MREREYTLRRVNTEFTTNNGIVQRDFNRALILAESLDPEQRVATSISIGLDLIRSGLDCPSIIDYLQKTQEGIESEASIDERFVKRQALYGLAQISLWKGDPQSAFSVTAQDPYPGNPFQPEMDLEIAKAYAKQRLDPKEPLERAKKTVGQNTHFAPNHVYFSEDQKLVDEISIVETACVVGKDPRSDLLQIRETIKAKGWPVIIGGKGAMNTYIAVAQIYARYGDLQTAYELIEEQLEDYKQIDIRRLKKAHESDTKDGIKGYDRELAPLMGSEISEAELIERSRRILEDKIREIEEKDQSESRSSFLYQVAEVALETGNIQGALKVIRRGANDISIAGIAGKAAVVANNRCEDTTYLINLALEKVDSKPPAEIVGNTYKLNNYRAKQTEILAIVCEVIEDPAPIFEKTIEMARALKPDMDSYRSFRSSVWDKLARSIVKRGFDATFAFEEATNLLELQNGPLVAKARLGDWQDSLGYENVGNWNYYKIDTWELAQSQLDAGYFDLAQSTIARFRAVDEGRYFTTVDEALFFSKKALALAKRSSQLV